MVSAGGGAWGSSAEAVEVEGVLVPFSGSPSCVGMEASVLWVLSRGMRSWELGL